MEVEFDFEIEQPHQSSENASEDIIGQFGIKIVQDPRLGCGGLVWEAAEVLIKYLLSKPIEEYTGKSILEIGSGTGAVGLALAKAHNKISLPFHLILTDLEHICPIMTANVVNNGMKREIENGKITINTLEWGNCNQAAHISNPDIILMSDCVYLENCFEPLLKTLQYFINHHVKCVMSYKKRRKAEKKFFYELKKLFNVIEVHGLNEKYSKNRLHLYEIYCKNLNQSEIVKL